MRNEMSKELREIMLCAILAVAIVLVITGGVIIAGGMVQAVRNPNTIYGQQTIKTDDRQWQCLTETVRGKTQIVSCETIKENQ